MAESDIVRALLREGISMIHSSEHPPVVMVVDDSKTIITTARVFLEEICDVIVVEDGFLALARLQDVKPDLIFLDVMMPRLDGYTTCMAIKQNPEFADIPIVMLSSKDSPFDKARGHLMGCVEYLTKPFSKSAIQETVIRLLDLTENLPETEQSLDSGPVQEAKSTLNDGGQA
jgi:twitching motility two-component system response regulator PilG